VHPKKTTQQPLLRSLGIAIFSLIILSSIESKAIDSIVVFNEINYHPAGNNHALEFIELYNQNSVNVDLTGWKLTGGIDYSFPENTIIEGRSFLVIALDPETIKETSGLGNVLGPYQGRLDNAGETVRLRNNNERIMDEITYNDKDPWPVSADGSGATLSKSLPMTASAPPQNWTSSPQILGTPGKINFQDSNLPPPTIKVPILSFDHEWRYNESGVDLGTEWASEEHPVTEDWKSGPGVHAKENRLEVDLGTELIRPALNKPYVITYYFETEFDLSEAQFNNAYELQITYLIDDGAIFYLNGNEVYRYNMPLGEVSSGTLASSGSEAKKTEPLGIPMAGLKSGKNRISVEVHQANSGSSDVVMGLELDLLQTLPDPSASPSLRLSEIAGNTDNNWSFELQNTGSNPVSINQFRASINGNEERAYILPEKSLPAGNFLTIEKSESSLNPQNGDRLFLYSPENFVIDSVIIRNEPQARLNERSDNSFYRPDSITPHSSNAISFSKDIVINEIMYHHRPQYSSPGTPPILETISLFDFNSVWLYNETGKDQGGDWAKTAQIPAGDWLAGQGPLGFETDAGKLPIPLGTWMKNPRESNPRFFTHYFETQFNISSQDKESIRELILTHMIDDGAVFYLNGTEVARYNLPAGTIDPNTPATSGVEATFRNISFEPNDLLLTGTNRISVELHQKSIGSSDFIMGLKFDARRATDNGDPGRSYIESDEQWVEIYNKSDKKVNLSGWKLNRAISFTFPQNTTIDPDAYLVISNDANSLKSKFPNSNAIGNFSGNLSNNSERIVLLDQKGNPVDEVTYYDGKPWPRHADGGGSSLELRDPEADNSVPEAWADSSNSDQSEWVQYSYTMTAEVPTYTPSIGNFHELRLGLLDAGEVLIDDVSVIEDPGGTNRELMQNGSFNAGNAEYWRRIGTHQLSEVVDTEESPALKIVASARMNYLNNLLESNLKSNGSRVPVKPGTDYQISFKAKWLKGSPQFRFELYYNRLAKTVILKQPIRHGTPGKENSTREPNIGPTFQDVTHYPPVPEPDQAITLSGRVNDLNGVNSLLLHYANDGSLFRIAPVILSDNGSWSIQIPGQKSGRKIHFYLEADDGESISFYPKNGPDSRAMIQIDDNRSSETIQNFRVIMTNRDSSTMHSSNEILSNHRYGCTIITNENEIYYDCGVRLRGSMFSRNSSDSTGINYKFPADKPYRGIHGTVTTRRRNVREIIAKHMINHAGGIHDNYNDIVQLIHTTQKGTARLSMARFGKPYLEGLSGGEGTEGIVFKMEGIRVFQSTQGGNPESPKLPFPIGWVSSFDLADQGDDKEIYRHNIRINSRLPKDRYDEIIAMCKAFSLRGQELEDEIKNVINVDMWMRQFAIMSLLGIGDTYSQGNPHNLNFYVRPSDGKVEPMPWDWDFLFSQSSSAGLWGGRNFAKIPARPVYGRIFHGHLVDIIESTFNSEYMNYWLTHYGSLAREGYTGFSSNIRSRSNYVMSRIPKQIPFNITTGVGNNLTVDGPTANISGNGWVDVSNVFIEGADLPLPIDWTDADSWEVSVPVQPGKNTINLTAFNRRGKEVGSDTIIIESTGNIASANSTNLTISEIMYHPEQENDNEFIELINLDPSKSVDLSGVYFKNGIDFTFQDRTIIGPGERIMISQNQFENNSRLSNSGERILLSDASGSIIIDFNYRDEGAWPESSDGNGFSLIRIDPAGDRDPNLPSEWRPSIETGGNPGTSDSITFSGENSSDLLAYAIPQTDDLRARINKDGKLIVTVLQILGADDALIELEYSTDGISWARLTDGDGIELTKRTHNGDGTESLEYKAISKNLINQDPAILFRAAVRLR
jgi:hypothetical protein